MADLDDGSRTRRDLGTSHDLEGAAKKGALRAGFPDDATKTVEGYLAETPEPSYSFGRPIDRYPGWFVMGVLALGAIAGWFGNSYTTPITSGIEVRISADEDEKCNPTALLTRGRSTEIFSLQKRTEEDVCVYRNDMASRLQSSPKATEIL
jgi:hypothetical protein